MARKYPTNKNRTLAQELLRRKNTEAARKSRARAKFLEKIVREEAKKANDVTRQLKASIASYRVYADKLSQDLKRPSTNWDKLWKDQMAVLEKENRLPKFSS